MAGAVAVNLPGGPLTADAMVHLDAAESLVVNTPFIDWTPVAAAAGAPARVAAPLFRLLRIFAARLSISSAAPDIAAANAVSVWRTRFNAAAWSRIFTELKASGYAAAPIATLRQSDLQLSTITLANPPRMQLVAADWLPSEAFTMPGGNAAAAVARRALLAPLQFLELVTAPMLQRPGNLPLQRLADISGYLGACATHASRYAVVGIPQSSAVTLSAACGPDTMANGVRAQRVGQTLDRLRLPSSLRSTSLEEHDLALELDDGITFHVSESSAKHVLEQRIFNLSPRLVGAPPWNPDVQQSRCFLPE